MKAEPQNEHQWLQKLVGEWSFEGECLMGAGQPPVKSTGAETVRSTGGLWTLGEGRWEMPGCGPMTSVMTLGYDPRKKRFVGTFIASMMTHLWVYEGALDASGTTLTLDTEGPGMSGPDKMAKYQDVITFEGDSHRILTSRVLGDDGAWHQFMTAHYRRKASRSMLRASVA
ncbi:MAG: DUF1579 domain-containing protein [Hyphomicrobiaceae bacterium]|nr:MAG: DUF1579 domain-containing protein [Hyphomicrobiaceae bacterium]